MELENCINFLITRSQNCVVQRFKQQLARHEITPGQYAVMHCIWERESIVSPSIIADRLFLDGSTITGLLDRLESKDFIKRSYSKEDRRSINIELTEKGSAIKEDVLKAVDDANEIVLQIFSEEERLVLKAFLSRLIHNLSG